jgi:hypothetical protein
MEKFGSLDNSLMRNSSERVDANPLNLIQKVLN